MTEEINLKKEEIIEVLDDIITGTESVIPISEQCDMFELISINLKVVKENLKQIFSGLEDYNDR